MSEKVIGSAEGNCEDYTIYRRQAFDDMTLEEINEIAILDAADNPFE